jgi:TetR/AcrR family transcriptional regulator
MAKSETRIQKKNQAAILSAGMKVFSQYGFRGSTLDQIASEAGMSKPNMIYYFASKDAIYRELLARLLEDWLQPIYEIDATGDPVTEILGYAKRKLAMSQNFPRESRLFANEILQGAPQIGDTLRGELRRVVNQLAAVIDKWVEDKRIRPVDPHHLIFSIWSMTQHYADFDVQVRAVIDDQDPFPGAERHLTDMITRMLSIDGG